MAAMIKQEPGTPVINLEEIEVVSKAELKELRACKRKLEETGPELVECKRRLEETRAKQQMDRKKWEQLSQMITKSVPFQPKRANIRVNLPDFAKSVGPNNQNEYSFFSEPKEIAGFQWKLRVSRKPKEATIGLFLYAYSPDNYEGPFEFEADCTFCLFNILSSKDIRKGNNGKINAAGGVSAAGGVGFLKFAEIKNLVEPKNGFLQEDGSILVEVDFTILSGTLYHLLADVNAVKKNSLGNNVD